jgi:16S rRNA (cytosine967-C5)-methyltransferase
MRKRLTGAELPAVSAPGPDANEVWRTVRHECPASEVLALRSLWAGLPPGMIPQLENRIAASGWSNQDALTFLDQHAARPPVWLRLLRPDVAETLREELATAQFSSREAGLAWSVKGVGGIFELPSYRAGNFDIQDFASQGIGDAVKARPGELIWDCCAGAGGKSLQLAASMAGEGTVTASDLHEGKLKDLRRRAERAGLANIQASVWDGKSVPDFSDAVKAQGGFDAVLVDAPCSGSGTWRRNVDGRLRLVPADLARWTEVQDFLLELVAEAVRPKGRLVYATCSWLTAENEQVIDAFLAKNPSWQLISQALAGNPQANSDTTFWAVMQRRQK